MQFAVDTDTDWTCNVQVFVTTLVLDLLNFFMLCTHQCMCSSSDTPAFRSFFISFHL